MSLWVMKATFLKTVASKARHKERGVVSQGELERDTKPQTESRESRVDESRTLTQANTVVGAQSGCGGQAWMSQLLACVVFPLKLKRPGFECWWG